MSMFRYTRTQRALTRPEGGTHWWLADAAGAIIDATAEQFAQPPPYASGMRTHFLSRDPSRRAAKLIARVRARLTAAT